MQTTNMFVGGFGFTKFVPMIGTKIPNYMLSANVDFVSRFMGRQLEQRVITVVDVDQKLIKDGDLIVARRLDGMDTFYMASTGSQIGHVAMALRDEKGELFIVEAQSAFYFKDGTSGVQSTKFADWLELANSADFDVAWIPLREDVRKSKFNAAKARQYFSLTSGAPYSHRAQFFSVVDTVEDNYFSPISSELVPFMVRYMQSLYPSTFDIVFKEALNKRLGIKDQKDFH